MSVNNIMTALASPGAPRVLTSASLRRLISRVNFSDENAADTITNSLVSVKAIHRVNDGTFLNYLQQPLPSPSEAIRLVIPGGYLSLHTVLGQCGFLNNPSNMYTCVRQANTYSPEGEEELLGRRFATNNPAPLYHVYSMAPGLPSGLDREDHLDAGFSYPRATPERALCDWLYLAKPSVGAFSKGPPYDSDVSALNMERLQKIADYLGVRKELESWLDINQLYYLDEDNDANMSVALGF